MILKTCKLQNQLHFAHPLERLVKEHNGKSILTLQRRRKKMKASLYHHITMQTSRRPVSSLYVKLVKHNVLSI